MKNQFEGQYQPSPEEVKKAEEAMTEEQKKMGYERYDTIIAGAEMIAFDELKHSIKELGIKKGDLIELTSGDISNPATKTFIFYGLDSINKVLEIGDVESGKPTDNRIARKIYGIKKIG